MFRTGGRSFAGAARIRNLNQGEQVIELKSFSNVAALSVLIAAATLSSAQAQPDRGTSLFNAAGVTGLPSLPSRSQKNGPNDDRWSFTLADVLDQALWRQRTESPAARPHSRRVQLTYAAHRRGINRPKSEFLP